MIIFRLFHAIVISQKLQFWYQNITRHHFYSNKFWNFGLYGFEYYTIMIWQHNNKPEMLSINESWIFDPSNISFHSVAILSAIGYPLKVCWWCVKEMLPFYITLLCTSELMYVYYFSLLADTYSFIIQGHILFPDLIAGFYPFNKVE